MQYTRPTPTQEFTFNRKKKKKSSHSFLVQKVLRAGSRYLTLPSVYSVRDGEFTMEYSRGNYTQVTLVQKYFLFDTILAAAGSTVFFL